VFRMIVEGRPQPEGQYQSQELARPLYQLLQRHLPDLAQNRGFAEQLVVELVNCGFMEQPPLMRTGRRSFLDTDAIHITTTPFGREFLGFVSKPKL